MISLYEIEPKTNRQKENQKPPYKQKSMMGWLHWEILPIKELFIPILLKMFKLVLEKAEEPEIKLPTPAGSSKKQESSRKTSISVLLTMPKPLTMWITINCGKFGKRWE